MAEKVLDLARYLEIYGPWAVCVVLFVGIGALYSHSSKQSEKYMKWFIEQNERNIIILQQNAAVLNTVAETNRHNVEVLNNVSELMISLQLDIERFHRDIAACEDLQRQIRGNR